MSVADVLDGEMFRNELKFQIEREQAHYDEMCQQAVKLKMRLQRAPIARLRERGVFNVEDMTAAYRMILVKQLDGFSAAEREYIKQVCMMAYWRVIEQLKKKEKEQGAE